jgi:GNAT superfamily N-acetyltransferase
MTLIYPNIVPENNLRLPDALTIKHGPAPLLSRFVLAGDRTARQMGIRLRLRYDFDELLYLNRQRIAHGDWYRLAHIFHPQYSNLSPENAYWISGENEHGDIVVTQAGRIYYWPDSTLEQEARLMFYAGREAGQRCVVTAADAKSITGVVFYGGSVWVRPDFRGRQLSQLLPRLGRAYALGRWPVDWGISLVAPVLVEKKVAAGYGYKHASYSISYPSSPWGDIDFVLVSVSKTEAYDDFVDILTNKFSGSEEMLGSAGVFSSNTRDDSVTKISSEGVFHGSNSRS